MSENSEILKVKSVIKDSFARAESNRNALRSKRPRKSVEYDIKRTEAIHNPDLPEEELALVVSQIQDDLRVRKRRQLVFFGVTATIVTIVSIVFLS